MIGVFDSGIGGLTVVRALLAQLPGYDIVYYGDTARSPYGTKSPETVAQYALEDARLLLDQGARIIVMACNTASSVAQGLVRDTLGVPVFEVITPAVEAALAATRRGCIGVIGTRATVRSGVYERAIRERAPECRVFAAACPLLVPLVEEGWMGRPETAMITKKYLRPLKASRIDTLILGCTHYPVLRALIQRKMGPQVRLIDSSEGLARRLAAFVAAPAGEALNLPRTGRHRFLVSDRTEHFEDIARRLLQRRLTLELIRL